jgi:hypothetical protein
MESIEQHPKLKTKESVRRFSQSGQRSRSPQREKLIMQLAQDTYRFDLGRAQYLRIRTIGLLFLCTLVISACIGIVVGILLWKSYPHNFTPYLKWQDALLSLSWFIAFISLGGAVMVVRFLHALHAGYTQGMVTLVKHSAITVRDLSAENLKNIFWIMNSAFWCFVAVLVGLLPVILIGWTLHLPNIALAVLTTSVAILLSLVGFVVSIIAASFIIVGCIGLVSFCRKLGSSHTYQLDHQATIRMDSLTLAITYPGTAESVVDMNLLAPDDRQQLLSLLRERWIDTEQVWSSDLDSSHTQNLSEYPDLA